MNIPDKIDWLNKHGHDAWKDSEEHLVIWTSNGGYQVTAEGNSKVEMYLNLFDRVKRELWQSCCWMDGTP